MTDKLGDIAILIKKHIQDELNLDETNTLKAWFDESEENQRVFNELTNENTLKQAVKDLYTFKQQNDKGQPSSVLILHQSNTKWFKVFVAAAAVIAVVCLVWLLANGNGNEKQYVITDTATKKTPQDLAPGGNKAVLTLADGSIIILDNAHNGLIAEQDKIAIRKKQDGELEYDNRSIQDEDNNSTLTANHPPVYNTVSTPRGGQYQLVLPDGSKVWLNAASSLKFPVSFTGKERIVQLTGEAYFEVVHVTMPGKVEGIPFLVQVNNGMKVKVLGTHFNIMAYEEEKETKTTLLEGKVKVIKEAGNPQGGKDPVSVLLQPGQQALFSNTDYNLSLRKDANTMEAVAWKNGLFKFGHTDLKSVMRQLARWYDVQVEYAPGLPDKYFTGEISRRLNASEVLSVIEFAGVHWRIEGKKIIVIP